MTCKTCGQNKVTPSGATAAAQIQTPETTEVRSWTSLPLLDVTDVPEDLDLIGGSNERYESWRIPASYFLPGGTLNNNQYKTHGNIEIPARQIVPVNVSNSELDPVAPAKAVEGALATDIAVACTPGEGTDIFGNPALGTVTLQKSGYYTFSRPHMYEIGKTYYLSQNAEGEVVSVRPAAGIIQPLFTVVDQTTISINVQLI